MPKILTMIGLILSVLIGLPFLIDLIFGVPFRWAHMWMDIIFVVSAVILGFLSWTTMREQI